jgi:hypothetical protein
VSGLEGFLLGMLTILPLFDMFASAFFIRQFWMSKDGNGRRSWLLGTISGACSIVTVVFTLFGYLAFQVTVGASVPWAFMATVVSLLVLGTVPLLFLAAWLIPRGGGE